MADDVILVAGNIGAGKTELVRYLQRNKDQFRNFSEAEEPLVIVPEFVDKEALELFYHNREKYTAIFERSCLIGRQVRHMKAKHSSGIYVFDRGMIEGAETFCLNSFEEGYLSHDEHEDYIRDLKRGLDQLGRTNPDSWLEKLIVYLKVDDPNILLDRQKKRGTTGETVPLEYLQRINDKYHSLFSDISKIYTGYGIRPPKVISIDASVDFNQDKGYHQRILEKILGELEFLKSR